jgi:hypothetical protein
MRTACPPYLSRVLVGMMFFVTTLVTTLFTMLFTMLFTNLFATLFAPTGVLYAVMSVVVIAI